MVKADELKRFEADLAASDELRAKFDEACKSIVESGSAGSDGEVLSKAAGELGYAVNVADFERAVADAQETDDEELSEVVGGVGFMPVSKSREDEHGHDVGCLIGWHCYVTMLHTATNSTQVRCLKNYVCEWFNN